MWKKIFAASAVAVGIAGILGSGSVFAAETPYNGEVIDITTTSPSICVDAHSVADYSGEPIIAYMWNDNYSRQIVFDRFGRVDCLMRPTVPSGTKLRFVIPMGIKNPTLSVGDDGRYELDVKDVSNNYLRSYGQSTTRVAKTRYRINFNMNGGDSGYMAPVQNVGTSDSIALQVNRYSRTGYRFVGWNTKADGTGIAYTDGATITLPAAGDLKLFAQWIEDKAVLDSGTTVNVKMKKLAGANSAGYDTVDEKIREIRTASALPAGFDTNDNSHIVSSSGSPFSIYAWFDDGDYNSDGRGDGIVYLYTDASKIETNNIPWFMFYNARSLSNISALSSWDTSGAGTMARMFYNTSSLSNISALSSWNTSNVWDISYMFDGASSLTDISALSSWDTSKVQNMKWMFHGASSLSNISALSSWNTSSVTSASAMFAGTKIANVNALETKQYAGNAYMSWDTSSMTDMSYMFDNCALLSDISALSSWNTSNVKNMSHIFYMYDQNSSLLSDISALSSWNTSNVTDMSYMLGNTKITNVNALETKRYAGKDYVSWDTSNVLDMSWVFSADKYLTDISALSSWNTSSVTKMDCMFYSASSLSNVSALSSWNTSNVEDMHSMFNGADSLTDVSALADWDVSSVTDMSYMFSNVPARPLPSWYHE